MSAPLPADVEARLDAMQVRYALTAGGRDALAAVLVLLDGDLHAPTTVTRPGEAVDQHIADSLVALDLPEVRAATTIADLGSGAGFPGLVLAIALPDAAVSLVESNGRKCAFISRAIAVTGAANATAVNSRAETWVDGRGLQDIVTARALAPLAVVAEYAAPLLRTGGTVVAWTGKREPELEDQASRAAAVLGLSPPVVAATAPFPGAQHHNLHLMSKLMDTPSQYPRRPGMARKRPLGALSGKRI
jgi:16S rRNA (guanine527-N7)-methyltransferase